jgi:hypothetical protein
MPLGQNAFSTMESREVEDHNLADWEPQNLVGDDTCEVRVYFDGGVMWCRKGTPCGPKLGVAVASIASDVPYTAFLTAWECELSRPFRADERRLTLFCGGCLVYPIHREMVNDSGNDEFNVWPLDVTSSVPYHDDSGVHDALAGVVSDADPGL